MLAWMDLEMTGLDPARHVVVEIATLLTDDELNVIEHGPDLVIAATDEQLSRMEPVVVEMHTKSGLLDLVKASDLTVADAAAATLEFLRSHIDAPGTVPLCGNSIGMDRRFLAVHMPEIEDFLHYRSIDVSTIKELARRWYPDVLAAAPTKEVGHRALDDITESLAELRHYRDRLFVVQRSDPAGDETAAADDRAATDGSAAADESADAAEATVPVGPAGQPDTSS